MHSMVPFRENTPYFGPFSFFCSIFIPVQVLMHPEDQSLRIDWCLCRALWDVLSDFGACGSLLQASSNLRTGLVLI